MLKKISILAMLIAFVSLQAFAQVTSGNLTGMVKDQKNSGLPGASVKATHLPSGTVYGTSSQDNGSFDLDGLRIGGPYKVEITYIGYEAQVFDNIYITLGEAYRLNARMSDGGKELGNVTVKATSRNPILNNQRTGASTNIGLGQISTLPSISRSINDFTRLTPQGGGGNSFGGRDGRYNNIQINGANFNNNFGVSSSNLPGGDAQPISLDAIEEIQVNIAPYDIRQSNFTGANINAVTRSGNNTLTGSVYGFYRNQNYNGKKIADYTLPDPLASTKKIMGFRLGGAIKKNKLFYFVNFEKESTITPQIPQIANPGSATGNPNQTSVLETDLIAVSNFLKNNYGYSTGAYQGYAEEWGSRNTKALVRLDYNINKNHKFNISFNTVTSENNQSINGTSVPGGVTRRSNNRISNTALTFDNSNYGFKNTVKNLSAELNSKFGSKLSNQLLATYTEIRDQRTSNSDIFPFIDILKSGSNYISAGYELFTYKNDVKNTVGTFIDNLTYKTGKHTIVAGIAYDFMTFGNSFLNGAGTGYYQYNSTADFLAGKRPLAFSYCYANEGQDPYVKLNIGMGSAYIQDKVNVTDRLVLTAGVRIDKPFYNNEITSNPFVDTLRLLNMDGKPTTYKSGMWPTTPATINPRLGFNWDVNGDRSLQVRGGVGAFSGRVPFVWFTNQPGSTGTLLNLVTITDTTRLNSIPLVADVNQIKTNNPTWFPTTPGRLLPTSGLAFVDPNFKMPQIIRLNVATDIKLKNNYILTLEAIYNKDINAVFQYDANLNNTTRVITEGNSTRPYYTSSSTRRFNTATDNVTVLSNTNKGEGFIFTTQIQKNFANGLYIMAAYTGSNVSDVSNNPGSRAISAWQSVANSSTPNTQVLGVSQYCVPHRIIASVSKKINWNNFTATTISAFYEGSTQGRFSYIYSSDINGDNSNADLIYVPNKASDLTFTDITGTGGVVLFSKQDQMEAFQKYIDQDKYLSTHKGGFADKSGAKFPWYHRLDLRILQDFNIQVNGKKHTIQFSADMLNALNFINKDWGIFQELNVNNAAILRPSVNSTTGTVTYQLNTTVDRATGMSVLPTSTFRNAYTNSSVWGLQLGLRYSF